jgi:tetratricopeptide (TPR) repeat protein
MPDNVMTGIVRVFGADEAVVGAGFLAAADGCILTCAHVVAGALGLRPVPQDLLEAEVQVDFPLVAPARVLTARVVHWQAAEDIAGLQLLDAPPERARPVPLAEADDPWGHAFRVFGFPAGYPNGVWASGRLLAREATGWLQIEDTKQTGYFVAPGFSGGPVWDETLAGVVGMIVAAEMRPGIRAAFCIPVEKLAESWPALAQAYLDAQMEQLRVKRDAEDRERRARRGRRRVVNLRPLDVTHTFKDRLREVQALCAHLADSSVRLVSVVGRGGMGKTALVSRVLADLEAGETSAVSVDGILYLSARSTGLGLERIYADVGRLLGEPAAGRLAARWANPDTPLAAKVEFLLERLQDGLYVILIDNLEDALTEDGDIAEDGLRLFVERCLVQPGGARLVVTSREEVRLPAAALHGARCILLRDGLPVDDAMALLRDLDPQGELGLGDAPKAHLRRAAQLTCGIPRALELLAGILQEDPTLRLPNLLDDARLFGDQVVERLAAEGHRRLEKQEQRVMEALAVFDRPAGATAVAYLLHPWHPGLDVRAALRRLARGYFVSVNRASGEYSLHPLDREYAYRQLPDNESSEAYTRRNLELRAAEFYASIRNPESEWRTIDDLAPQLAELEHRARAGDYDGACQVLEPIDFNYLYLWGHCGLLAEMRNKLLEGLTDPVLAAANLGSLARVYLVLGQAELAADCYNEALVIARRIGDRRSEGIWLGYLGRAYLNLGQIQMAIDSYSGALRIAHEVGNLNEEGIWLANLGLAYRALGQVKQAIQCYENALTIVRQTGDRQNEGIWCGHLGLAYHTLGQLDRAIALYEKALGIAREIGDRRHEVVWLNNLGNVYCTKGQAKQAVNFYEQASPIAREIGYHRGQGYQLLGLGRALLMAGEFPEGQRCCAEALGLDIPTVSHRAATLTGIALLCQHDPTAERTFLDAIARCRALLEKTPGLYEPRYALAAALVGQAACDPHWADLDHRAALLVPALAEYRQALQTCAAFGFVRDALQDLELIRAAGIEGLEPVFELLEAAVPKESQ